MYDIQIVFKVIFSITYKKYILSLTERYCKVTIFNITSRIILQLFSCSNWSILLWTHKVRRISKKMSTARGIRPGCLYNDDWCRNGKIRQQKTEEEASRRQILKENPGHMISSETSTYFIKDSART